MFHSFPCCFIYFPKDFSKLQCIHHLVIKWSRLWPCSLSALGRGIVFGMHQSLVSGGVSFLGRGIVAYLALVRTYVEGGSEVAHNVSSVGGRVSAAFVVTVAEFSFFRGEGFKQSVVFFVQFLRIKQVLGFGNRTTIVQLFLGYISG